MNLRDIILLNAANTKLYVIILLYIYGQECSDLKTRVSILEQVVYNQQTLIERHELQHQELIIEMETRFQDLVQQSSPKTREVATPSQVNDQVIKAEPSLLKQKPSALSKQIRDNLCYYQYFPCFYFASIGFKITERVVVFLTN